MSDNTFAYYDADRDAVIVRAESGHEIDVLTRDDAASLARELLAASMRQDTGYGEFLAQESGTDTDGETDEQPDVDPTPYAGYGSGDQGYDEAQAQEAEIAALSQPTERTYAVLARFIVTATSENDASGEITTDLAAHPAVDEVWVESTYTD